MGWAKDFPYEYIRTWDRVRYVGLALFNDNRNGDLPSQEPEYRETLARLRAAGIKYRVVRGVYGSRHYANALRGWMVFIVPDKDRTAENQALLNDIDEKYA